MVAAPSPFAQLPDSTLKTGLMEEGNPNSGQIGIGFASEQQIVDAGFQRGWEKFRAPDGAIAQVIYLARQVGRDRCGSQPDLDPGRSYYRLWDSGGSNSPSNNALAGCSQGAWQ